MNVRERHETQCHVESGFFIVPLIVMVIYIYIYIYLIYIYIFNIYIYTYIYTYIYIYIYIYNFLKLSSLHIVFSLVCIIPFALLEIILDIFLVT